MFMVNVGDVTTRKFKLKKAYFAISITYFFTVAWDFGPEKWHVIFGELADRVSFVFR